MNDTRVAIFASARRFLPYIALSAALAIAWLMLSATMAHADERGPDRRDVGHASQARDHHRPGSQHLAFSDMSRRLSHAGNRHRTSDHASQRTRSANPRHHAREAVKHTGKSVWRTVATVPVVGKSAAELKAVKRLSEVGSELKRVGVPLVNTVGDTRHAIRDSIRSALEDLGQVAATPVPGSGSSDGAATSPSSRSDKHAAQRSHSHRAHGIDANRQAGQGIGASALKDLRTFRAAKGGHVQTLSHRTGFPGSLPLQGAPTPLGDGVSQGHGSGAAAASVMPTLRSSSRLVAKHRLAFSGWDLPSGPTFPPSSSPD
jgi:hypothetical protein